MVHGCTTTSSVRIWITIQSLKGAIRSLGAYPLQPRTPELTSTSTLILYRDLARATIRSRVEATHCYTFQLVTVGELARARGLGLT
eukprot:6214842-Pleurochrysis_carterae.AAC.4